MMSARAGGAAFAQICFDALRSEHFEEVLGALWSGRSRVDALMSARAAVCQRAQTAAGVRDDLVQLGLYAAAHCALRWQRALKGVAQRRQHVARRARLQQGCMNVVLDERDAASLGVRRLDNVSDSLRDRRNLVGFLVRNVNAVLGARARVSNERVPENRNKKRAEPSARERSAKHSGRSHTKAGRRQRENWRRGGAASALTKIRPQRP